MYTGGLLISSALYLQPTGLRFALAPVRVKLKYDPNVLKSGQGKAPHTPHPNILKSLEQTRLVAKARLCFEKQTPCTTHDYASGMTPNIEYPVLLTGKLVTVRRFNTSSMSWRDVLNSSSVAADNGSAAYAYAQGTIDSFSYYAAFLIDREDTVRVSPPPEEAGSDSSLWSRLKYTEKVLVVVLPIAACLAAGACYCVYCVWYVRHSQSHTFKLGRSKHASDSAPDLELSFRDSARPSNGLARDRARGQDSGQGPRGRDQNNARDDTCSTQIQAPTAESIRSIVRQQLQEELQHREEELSRTKMSRSTDWDAERTTLSSMTERGREGGKNLLVTPRPSAWGSDGRSPKSLGGGVDASGNDMSVSVSILDHTVSSINVYNLCQHDTPHQ